MATGRPQSGPFQRGASVAAPTVWRLARQSHRQSPFNQLSLDARLALLNHVKFLVTPKAGRIQFSFDKTEFN